MSQAAAATHLVEAQAGGSPKAASPKVRVKTAKGLTSSLFAQLPDPLVDEIQATDTESITPDQALELIRRWKKIVS